MDGRCSLWRRKKRSSWLEKLAVLLGRAAGDQLARTTENTGENEKKKKVMYKSDE